MNLQLLLTSAVGGALALSAPAVSIDSFDDLTAHIPEAENHQIITEPVALPIDVDLPEVLRTGPSESAADLNSHVLFRGVDINNNADPFHTAHQEETLNIDEAELNCLAQNIYFEARGESIAGQMAVGLVTMNRAHSGNGVYPATICGVVFQGNLNGSPPARNACQFAWYCDGIQERITDEDAWERSVTIASRLLENRVRDFTDGATNFHATSSSPRWAQRMTETIRIDNHVFLR